MINLDFLRDLPLPEFYDFEGDFEPLWLIVFLLAVLVAHFSRFRRVSFVEPGEILLLCEAQTLINLSLWLSIDGQTVRINEVQGDGFYAERIDEYCLAVSGLTAGREGFLNLVTNIGTFKFFVKYGPYSCVIYLVRKGERYFQYDRDEYSLASDVITGFNWLKENMLNHDSQYYNFLLQIENLVVGWFTSVKSGELVREAAKFYNLPVGFIKFLAKIGKRVRLGQMTSEIRDNVLAISAAPNLAIPSSHAQAGSDNSSLQSDI